MKEHEEEENAQQNKINKIHMNSITAQTNHTLGRYCAFYRFILLKGLPQYYTVAL